LKGSDEGGVGVDEDDDDEGEPIKLITSPWVLGNDDTMIRTQIKYRQP
jgi:hypothetical protein